MHEIWTLQNTKEAMIEVAIATRGPVLGRGEKREVVEKSYADQLKKELYDLRKAIYTAIHEEVDSGQEDWKEILRLMGDWSPDIGENNSGDNPANIRTTTTKKIFNKRYDEQLRQSRNRAD